MAAKKKRAADNYLTHDNWDNDEDSAEPEDPGVFKTADDDELAKRTIRKAKRRGTSSASVSSGGEENKSSNPFAKFGGFGGGAAPFLTFGASKPVVPASKPIVPLTTNSSIENKQNNFWGSKPEEEKQGFFANRKPEPAVSKENVKIDNNNIKENKSETMTDNKEDFDTQLCQLNLSILKFIQKHIDQNPCIDLRPVFGDYEKHFKGLETKHNYNFRADSNNASAKETKTEEPIKQFKTPENSGTPALAVKPPAFGNMFKSSTPIQPNLFGGETKPTSSVFSAAASPFSFKPSTTSSTSSTSNVPATVKEESNDPEDKVPEPERNTVVEENAFHQTRCKLFYKKGSEWKELGIGMLYLKPGSDDKKIQLLVRMETTTGKVLMNVTVTTDTPTSRSGKNNVMVVTIPNPPVFSKAADGDNSLPCTYLIRVKGTSEADELFEKLKK